MPLTKKKKTKGILMHKDIVVAEVTFGPDMVPVRIEVLDTDHMPVGVNATAGSLAYWLSMRNMPESRPGASFVLGQYGATVAAAFAGLSHNISLTDCYWFADPHELDRGVSWADVSPWHSGLWTKSGQAVFAGHLDYFNDLDTPDFALTGKTPKTWVREDDGIFMLKADAEDGWMTFSEIAASETARLLDFSHVPYFFSIDGDKVYAGCPCMLSGDTEELVQLWQLEREGIGKEDLDGFFNSFGLLPEYGRMLILDYLTGNTGRTLADVSIVRSPDTLEVAGMAPVYGNGNGYRTESTASADPAYITSPLTGNTLLEDMERCAAFAEGAVLNQRELELVLTRICDEIGLTGVRREAAVGNAIERAGIYNSTIRKAMAMATAVPAGTAAPAGDMPEENGRTNNAPGEHEDGAGKGSHRPTDD